MFFFILIFTLDSLLTFILEQGITNAVFTRYFFKSTTKSILIIIYMYFIIVKPSNASSLFWRFSIKSIIKSLDFTFIFAFFTYLHDIFHPNSVVFCLKDFAPVEILNQDMRVVLLQLRKMLFDMDNLKRKNNLELIIDKNNNLFLEVDENSSLSEQDIYTLTQKINIADRVFNTQIVEYEKLVAKDKNLYKGVLSKGFENSLNRIKADHEKLFKHED